MRNEEEEKEVVAEVEAVEAVYGTDCVLLRSFPPHFHISLKPRTADVSSQQEAADKVSSMNHPDGDCPLCLFPLVPEDQQSETLPFMKLMSCFHCFHSEYIFRWWKWFQNSKEVDSANTDNAAAHHNQDNPKKMEESVGNCPVCHKPFLAKHLDHVLALSSDNEEVNDEEKLLQTEHEIIRRQKFEAILNLPKENSGLIEPKKDIVILPGMYLPQPVSMPSSTATEVSNEQQQKVPPAVVSGKHESETPNGNGPSSSRQRKFGARRQKASDNHSCSTARYPRKPAQQWVRRDNPSNKP